MEITKIVEMGKDFVEDHSDEIVDEVKERAPAIKDDLAELKDIVQGDGSLTDKATQAFEAIKDPGNPCEDAPKE